MPDTTAEIRSKKLGSTGVTEELAEVLRAHKGNHFMFIVEGKVDTVHEKADGTAKVDIVLEQVEIADKRDVAGQRLDEHLRELTRTLYFNRQLDSGQPTLSDDGGPDPKLEDVLRDGQALVERDDDGNPVGLWPGDDEDEPGTTGDELEQLGAPFPDDEDDLAEQDDGSVDDAITDPHTFVDTPSALCALCGKPAGNQLHRAAVFTIPFGDTQDAS